MVVDVAEGVRVARLERLPYLQGEGVPAAPDQADHLLQLQKKVHTKVLNPGEGPGLLHDCEPSCEPSFEALPGRSSTAGSCGS